MLNAADGDDEQDGAGGEAPGARPVRRVRPHQPDRRAARARRRARRRRRRTGPRRRPCREGARAATAISPSAPEAICHMTNEIAVRAHREHRAEQAEAAADVAERVLALAQHVHQPEDRGHERDQGEHPEQARGEPAVHVSGDRRQLRAFVAVEARRDDRRTRGRTAARGPSRSRPPSCAFRAKRNAWSSKPSFVGSNGCACEIHPLVPIVTTWPKES